MKVFDLPKLGLVALAASVSLPAWADDMSYTYVEAAYVDTDIDDGLDVDGDGFAVGGSFEISESFFLTGGYSAQDFDFGIDLDQWSVGIGGHMPLADDIDLVGTLRYVDAEIDTRFGDADDDGFGVGVGVRARVTDNIELEGGINYVDLDDAGDDTSLAAGARYYLSNEFAVGAGFQIGDDVTSWNIGVRLEF